MRKSQAPDQGAVRELVGLLIVVVLDECWGHVVIPHVVAGDDDFSGANFFDQIEKVIRCSFPL